MDLLKAILMILLVLVGITVACGLFSSVLFFLLGLIFGEDKKDDNPVIEAGAKVRSLISDKIGERRQNEFTFFKTARETVIDEKIIYLLSNGKDGGILKDVYYEACSKYCEEHGGVSGDPISQCLVYYAGRNYNVIFARYGDDVMVSIRKWVL